MRYELWDTNARFFLGRFTSEAEALGFVQQVLDIEGDAYADNLELAIGEDGVANLSGADLTARARALDTHVQAMQPSGMSRS